MLFKRARIIRCVVLAVAFGVVFAYCQQGLAQFPSRGPGQMRGDQGRGGFGGFGGFGGRGGFSGRPGFSGGSFSGRGPFPSSPAQAPSSRTDSTRSSSSSTTSRTSRPKPQGEPLVPGFGLEEELPAVPGFGSMGDFYTVKVSDQDRSYAERSFRYYDRNQDGAIDREEMARSRSGDLQQYDKNGDGKLTLQELAVRYARRRLDAEKSQSSRSSTSSRGYPSSSSSNSSRSYSFSSRSSSSSPTSSSSSSRMEMITRSIFDRYDSNKSGVIEKSEWGNFRTDPSAADTNKDGKITRDEMTAWMSSRFSRGRDSSSDGGRDSGRDGGRFGSRRFGGPSSGGPSFGGRSSFGGSRFSRGGDDGRSRSSSTGGEISAGDSDRMSYRFLTPSERLPVGLPQWFLDRDKNGDGQVQMSEYTSFWTDALAEEFYRYDGNQDGIVTPKEALAANDLGSSPGGTSSGFSLNNSGGYSSPPASANPPTFTSPSSPTNPPASSTPAATTNVATQTGNDNQANQTTSSGGSIDPRTLAFFRKVLAQSDANKDGILTKEEWSKMSKDPSPADANSDGKITVEEYARWRTKR